MARRPGLIALAAALTCALAGIGFVRYAVDAGPDLLVGQSSHAKQVYDRFAANFGADPIVVVMAVQNPTAFYIEKNLLRVSALEGDLARDPRVATVLGPGTVAGSAQEAAAREIQRVRDEYPYFVAETVLASSIAKGDTDPTKLSQIESNAFQAAQVAMAAEIVKAAEDADAARAAYDKQAAQHKDDQLLRAREQGAEKAASNTQPPPFFAQYVAGPAAKNVDDRAAQGLFDQLAAGFGDCSDEIAAALHITTDCQVFLERLFLDLPNCPTIASGHFCQPKQQWAAVLPKRTGTISLAVITVRLKPEVVGHADQVNGLVAKINDELQHGQPHSSNAPTRSLGAFAPTECGTPDTSNGPSACEQHYQDRKADWTIAGAPLLVQGVAGTMSHLLLALFPIAFLVMLLLLLGAFRVRGRVWPLVGAGGAALLTIGGGLLLGVSISPAVLAGVPVLAGLGVDYAVQLVARFSEERDRGVGLEASLRLTLGNTGPATLIAGVATLAGVAALALLTLFDLGPLVGVPLVAEFALVLCAGVVFSWLTAMFVALPAAAWRERRRELREGPPAAVVAASDVPVEAPRTAALASQWRSVLIPATLLAVVGWAVMPRLPIETGVEKLLAPSLTELRDINSVRGAIGYDNEIDYAVEGNIVGTDRTAAVPDTVVFMATAAACVRAAHPGDVPLAITIGDVFTASNQGGSGTSCSGRPVIPNGGGASPSPSPSPSNGGASPAASPSASGSPTAVRPSPTPGARVDGDVVRADRAVLAATTPSPAQTATPTPAPSATPAPSSSGAASTPAPTPSITQPDASGTFQSAFICSLRLLPPLAHNLVGPLPVQAQPCPVRDLYRNVFLGADPSPVSPKMARMAIGVRLTSVADQAKLIDQLNGDIAQAKKGFDKLPDLTVTATGLTALAAQAYENLTSRILLLNLVPLAVVALVLLAVFREPRRALLPVLPATLAAGWSSLIVELLGHLPGAAGTALGSLNPLTVVLGALVIALGTEFGVVLLQRFYEERGNGRDPEAAAAAALHGVGRAVLVSAGTLGAGFAVLALSGPAPGGLPLIADFGLAVLIDLALAVGAVFLVMLPLAVALERISPLAVPAPITAGGGFRSRQPAQPAGRAGKGGKQRVALRPAAAAARQPEVVEEVDAAYEPEDTEEFEEFEEPERVWGVPEPAAPAAPEPAPAGQAASATKPSPAGKAARAPEPALAQQAAPAAPAEPPPAASARRLPGMSGRRAASPPQTPETPGGAGVTLPPSTPPGVVPGASRPARLPGVSGRRRPAGSEAAPPSAPATAPPPRRMPGGVTRRISASGEPGAEVVSPEPPAAPEFPPPPAAGPDARPPRSPDAPPRSRRRRPPPWMRQKNPPPGGDAPT